MLRDFVVYQLSKEFHWKCCGLRLHRVFRDQIFRASSSVAFNIAEGSGKRTVDDQRRYYTNALGSLRECEAILDLGRVNDVAILKLMDSIGKMLFKLSKPERKTQNQKLRTETPNPEQKQQTDFESDS